MLFALHNPFFLLDQDRFLSCPRQYEHDDVELFFSLAVVIDDLDGRFLRADSFFHFFFRVIRLMLLFFWLSGRAAADSPFPQARSIPIPS